jgi:hypothetical protein
MVGTCKLCGEENKELRNSHLLAKGLYPEETVIMTPEIALITDKQIAAPLLCEDCEQRFNKYGECWMLRQVNSEKGFPLLERLKLAIPVITSGLYQYQAFSCTQTGIDSDQLAYFVLSVLWRASVKTWTLLGQVTNVTLAAHEEPVRQYLLGKTVFPADTVVHVTVCTDFASQGSFHVPCRVSESPYTAFALLTQGIYFMVLMGEKLPLDVRQLCCVTGSRKLIFMASCEDKTLQAFARLYATARVARSLQARVPTAQS